MKSTKLTVYGRKPVIELIESQPKNIYQVYIRENGTGEFFAGAHALAKKQKVLIQKVPQKKITELAGDVNDQGIVAVIKEFVYADFHAWMDALNLEEKPAVLLLDEIEDPHNVGAIIRSAAAFGISAVLLPTHRQAGVSSTVFKTSAGAVSKIPIIQIGNVNQTIDVLKHAGFWVAGLADGEDAQTLWDVTFDTPTVFIVGNEGEGIRKKTSEYCDFMIKVPMQEGIDSLNASVASALACYEWRRQRGKQS
jgi:23S rRNA (guanosine2251-2'-O)-methyltransferase